MFFKDITANDLHRLVNVVCNNQTTSRLTGIFDRLHKDAKVGNKYGPKKRDIRLSVSDINEIQKLFYKETEYHLLNGYPSTRIEASILKVCSEKVSKFSPKERIVEIRSFDGEILINGKSYRVPPASALTINEHQIESIEHGCLLIIENYEAFINAELALFTDEVANALIIYRGDKEGGAVKSFIDRAGKVVYGWFDSDPQGINLALATKNIVSMYLPANHRALYKEFGVTTAYNEQKKFIYNIVKRVSSYDYLIKTVNIYEETGKCLMQEAMVKQRLDLVLVDLD